MNRVAEAGKKGLHAVETSEEYKKKLKAHRRTIRIVVILVVILIVAGLIGVKLYLDGKEYTEYEVVNVKERVPGAVSEYVPYAKGFLKYNHDGATYIELNGSMIWNQPYELEDPTVCVGSHAACVYEKNGKKLYIMSDETAKMGVDVTVPIKRVSVSDSGVVAVLMEEAGVARIALYDSDGEQLANGELYSSNIGYPMDLAISNDGRLLMVTILSISEARISTNIIFYNFGNVGRNEVDNIVGTYTYDGIMVPRAEYLEGDYAIAVSTEEVLVFYGSQKPEEYARYPITGEAKAFFCGTDRFGFTFDDHIDVYKPESGKVFTYKDDFDKCNVSFMDDGEISAIGETRVSIYDMSGIRRFHSEEENGVIMVKRSIATHYLFIYKDSITEVRLK